MNSIAIIEYTVAVVLGISLIGLIPWYKSKGIERWPVLCLTFSIFWLIIDATSYVILDHPETPYLIQYVVFLLSYFMGSIIFIFLIRYRLMYVSAKTSINPWLYRVPMIAMGVNTVVIIEEFIRGNICIFENGTLAFDNGLPTFCSLLWALVLFYLPLVALFKRKSLGVKAVFLLGMFDYLPITTIIISIIYPNIDLSVFFGALLLFLTVTFLQNMKADEQNEELENSNKRFKLLYDIIQAKSWSYQISARDIVLSAEYSREALNVVDAKSISVSPMGWLNYVHPDDRESAEKAFMAAVKDHSGKTPYEVTYRIRKADGSYVWIKNSGRVIRRKDGSGELFGMCIDITDQMEEQQRLKKNEVDNVKRLMNMVFALSDEYDPIIVVEPESGEYDWYMSKASEIESNTSMTLHGDNLYENIGIDGASVIHEDDRERFQSFYTRENMMKIAQTGEAQETENRWYVPLEKAYRWKYNKAVRMVDDNGKTFIVVGVIDTTEQKEKEEEYSKQKKIIEEQQALSDGLAREYHTVWLVDGFGEHRLHLYRSTGKKTVRRAVQRGLDEPTYDGTMVKYVMDSVHEDDRERVLEASKFETVERETPDVGTYVVSYKRYCDDEGNIDYHQMCFAKAVAADGTVNYILAFRDADKMLREQIAQQQQLEEARNAAEASNKAKTNFLFNMSHDIRTPMNAITGFTNMAIRHIDEKERVLNYLSKVQQSGNILLSLINNVLEVSRIESGKASVEEQPGDVYYSFANIEDTMKELAGTKDINISFKVDNIKDRYVYADFNRCMRVFVNIVTNAIKYTPAGGTVKVSCEQIEETREGYGTYKYVFEDNGIGMSEEFQKHIFEQFTRENNATVSGIQGSGLGMSVVKSFTELMGGTITVKSKKDEGSTFTIILPFKLQDGQSFIDPTTGEVVSIGEPLYENYKVVFKGKKILLVDDNDYNREISREILEDEGIAVDEAIDGAKAIDILKEKGPDYYDFVLMDIQMPVMNGYEATMEIRKMFPDSKLPIIALSANAFNEDKTASLEAGMDDHIAKPVKIKDLFNCLKKFV